jgi:hypothetical protein
MRTALRRLTTHFLILPRLEERQAGVQVEEESEPWRRADWVSHGKAEAGWVSHTPTAELVWGFFFFSFFYFLVVFFL